MNEKLRLSLTLLLALVVQLTFAQEAKTVTGTVVDPEGLPLPGVNILVKGTQTGAQTNFDGAYSISVRRNEILVFSYVGFESVERRIGDASIINVTLATDASELEEVVLMGYISKRKEDMTGSASQVGASELEQVPVATVDQALQGKVAGLSISSNSGTPGSTTNIRIRGRSSITAGNEPLYVIDGVPMVTGSLNAAEGGSPLSALASINSSDIESITVLKDATSTAAYGARGANGVIVINTKSGEAGKTVISVNSSYGFSNNAINGPTVLTGAQREELFYEGVQNTHLGGISMTTAEAREWEAQNLGSSYGVDYRAWNEQGRPEGNWEDIITNEDAAIQEYNLSARGGGENHNFYASLGYFDQEATVIGTEFNRTSGSLNFSQDINDNLRFNTSNTASYTYQDGTLEGTSDFSAPRAAIYFMPGIDQPYNDDGSINLDTSLPNPLWIAQEDIDDQKFTRILTTNSLDWNTPIENLSFRTQISLDYRVYDYKQYRNPIAGDGPATNGYGWQAKRNALTSVFQNSFDYNLQQDDHRLSFKVLQEFQKNKTSYLEAEGTNYATLGLTNLAVAGNPTGAYSSFTDWSVASYLGNVSYSFDDRYVLDGTYRKEGNSRFGHDRRWGNFWSVGGAWNLHREGFLENNDDINMLKLRASYGVTGNAEIGLNSYQVLVGFTADYAGTGAAFPASYGNEDLTWETSQSYDFGLDFAFLQNRLSGTLSYYSRESNDLLLNVPLSRTTGFANQTRNIGSMANSGFEAELEWEVFRSDDFNLSIGGNLATNENEVLSMPRDTNGEEVTITTTSQRVAEGRPAYAWFLPEWAGIDPDTGLDTWYTNGRGSEITENYNQANRVYQGGSALPTLQGGANLHIDFKGFFVDASAFYQGGHKVYESWNRYTQATDLYSTGIYQGLDVLMDRWQQPGDVTRIGKIQHNTTPSRTSSKHLFDGDFARLRNLTFGYNLASALTESIGVTNASVFVRGTNLATWVKDENLIYDPEINASGFTELFTPPTKSVIFGINLTL